MRPDFGVQLLGALEVGLLEFARVRRRNGRELDPALAAVLDALRSPSVPQRPELGDPGRLALSYGEAGQRLGVSARTIRRMVADGRLPALRIGARVLVPVTTIEEYANGRATAGR